jgi:membrane dipeptidase
MAELPLVDSHLDLAENVTLFKRDLTLSVAEIRASENRTSRQATVSLAELVRGGVAVAVATVTAGFLEADVPVGAVPRSALYTTAEEAERHALEQVAVYERWAREGRVRLLRSLVDLKDHLTLWQQDLTPGLVLLMEGADPIVDVRDLPAWWRRGLRMIGLTFGDTRYGMGVAAGSSTFKRGGLTREGHALLSAMAETGLAWDISHLTEDGVWDGLIGEHPLVCASHANARALSPTDRHLSDDVIRAIAEHDGVIGLVLYNGFLDPDWNSHRATEVTLRTHLRRHAAHIARLTGWNHVGLGSDLDGGFGREESPAEIDTVADLYRAGVAVPARARARFLGGNWLRFLKSSLPARTFA